MEPSLLIVMELMKGGSLKKYLWDMRPCCPDLPTSISFALDIAQVMECLHSNGIIHRDLKPSNLLLTEDRKKVKLADFGLAREETVDEMMSSEAGTYRWMAPELYSTVPLRRGEKKYYDHKVDIYSFSIVLWELLTNSTPFKGMTSIQAAYAVVKLEDPKLDIHKEGKYLMLAVKEIVSSDLCEGRFVFGRESKKARETSENSGNNNFNRDGTNPKSLLQTLLMRAGHSPPNYKTKHLKTNEFRALVEFKGMQFVGKPKKNKQLAERDAAIEALAWLTHTSDTKRYEDDGTPLDVTENMLKLLGKRKRSSKRRSG